MYLDYIILLFTVITNTSGIQMLTGPEFHLFRVVVEVMGHFIVVVLISFILTFELFEDD